MYLATASERAVADVQCCQALMFNTDVHHGIENDAKRCGKPLDN